MRQLPYQPFDDEDLKILQSSIEKKDAKYKRNVLYTSTIEEKKKVNYNNL